MKLILAVCSVIIIGLSSTFSQTVRDEPQRFSYHVWGSVVDEYSQPMVNISVCFLWVDGPLHGRIPCTKTNYEGEFALTIKGVPDKYVVSASSSEYLPFLLQRDEKKHYREKYSEIIEFGAKDECRKVTLQFDAQQTSN